MISHTGVTQLVLRLWLDNTEQLQDSSHEDEDKENKAVFKSVTSVIILEGGWEGEGRQHSVRAATTQVWVQLYSKRVLLIGKVIALFQGKPISLGNSSKQHQQVFCVEKYEYKSLEMHPGHCGMANCCSSAACRLGCNI